MASTTEQLTRSDRLAFNQIRGVKLAQFDAHKFNIPQMTNLFVWDGPVDYTYTDYTTDIISHISSSNAGDTGQIQIVGLDINWDEVIQIVTLDGQNKVALSTGLIRINNAISLKNLIGNVYIYEDGTITGGIPDDLTSVKGFISPSNNKTKLASFSVPRGYSLNFREAFFGAIPVTTTCCFRVQTYVKYFNGADVLLFDGPLVNGGSTFISIFPSTSQIFPEKADLYLKVYTSLPNSAITVIFDAELIKI